MYLIIWLCKVAFSAPIVINSRRERNIFIYNIDRRCKSVLYPSCVLNSGAIWFLFSTEPASPHDMIIHLLHNVIVYMHRPMGESIRAPGYTGYLFVPWYLHNHVLWLLCG
jgi:hypothetical protein